MENSKKLELENHLLRIKGTIDSWSTAERHAGSKNLEVQLIKLGMPIDEATQATIDKFNAGLIGFDELSEFFKDIFV
jgi:hypothetical protein